jgi:hypothetical protein
MKETRKIRCINDPVKMIFYPVPDSDLQLILTKIGIFVGKPIRIINKHS